MGRSRFHSADEDPSQRSRRKKNASSENSESSNTGQGTSDGKALYHCNYCNKDITGKIRIKCCICPDFDLCVECFSVGAEVQPHKSNHSYRVMDNLSFPLICPDWNADEEILLLEGIEMYGLGNWTEVAEHVGTKSKEQCINHFTEIYMKSPNFPLPDMSHVVGKNRKELLAMAKGQNEDKKELNGKDESPFSPRIKAEELQKSGSSSRLLSSLADCGTNAANVKLEDPPLERPFKGKKPVSSNDGPSLVEMSGYNAKRNEFDTEYDNDAEQLIADMEFKETDTADERELKLRVLRIYSKRLDERQRRKDFVVERNLLYSDAFEKDFSAEERAICRSFDKFMPFTTKEKYEEFISAAISEHRTLKRIQDLKEAQSAGCRTPAEADRYLERKKRKEEDEANRRGKENVHSGPNAESKPVDTSSGGDTGNVTLNGEALLSEVEKQLCTEIGFTPAYYLKMQEIMSIQVFRRVINRKSDAHQVFIKLEPAKVDAVYDMLVKKGIAPP